MKELVTTNEAQTQDIAERLGRILEAGDVLVLTGGLGAGKTTFTKGLAKGLGIDQMIKSPTYTIVREYRQGRLPLFHMDVYRLTEGADDLGLYEYFESDGVCVVEWGQMIPEELPASYVEIILENQSDECSRKLSFRSNTSESNALMQRIEATF